MPGTQPLKLPNGQTVQIPAEWGPTEAKAWLDKQPHVKAQWQKDFDAGVDNTIPDAMGLGKLLKSAIKGTVDTVAHPIENAPTVGSMLGTGAAAALEGLTGGLATPLAIGLPAAGAALGHGFRDFIRHEENDPRASKSLGDELLAAGGSGALEGLLSGAGLGAGKLLGKVGPALKGSAISTYTKALSPTIEQIKKLPVGVLPGGGRMTLAEKALKLGEEGLNRKVPVSSQGFQELQQMMDNLGGVKDSLLQASPARFTPATELLDPATNPALAAAKTKFAKTLTPQDSQVTFQALEDAVRTSPSLTSGGVPNVLNAKEMHELASNSAGVLGDVFGGTKSVGKEAAKALNTGAMDLLKSRVPDLAAHSGQAERGFRGR